MGKTVQLDGSRSLDVDGDLLTYRWSFVSKPVASSASLSDPASVRPTFVVDLPGIYVLQLIVNDGQLDSPPVTCIITTGNSRPVASAGPDQTVYVGNTVQLDGSGSRDVDGDPLSFWWSFTSLPPGSTAVLSNPAVVNPTFTIDHSGTYTLQPIVNDGQMREDGDVGAKTNYFPGSWRPLFAFAPTFRSKVRLRASKASQPPFRYMANQL